MNAVVIQEVRAFLASGRRRQSYVTTQTKTVAVEEKPVPEIGDNELLVKIEYLAVNPTDWKRASIFLVFGGSPILTHRSNRREIHHPWVSSPQHPVASDEANLTPRL